MSERLDHSSWPEHIRRHIHTFDFGAALRKSPLGKLGKRAAKFGYRYLIRRSEHILEHKDGDRHFRSMNEVEHFIGFIENNS